MILSALALLAVAPAQAAGLHAEERRVRFALMGGTAAQAPLLAYLLRRRVYACWLGGTAAQATALVRTVAFSAWTPVGESFSASSKPPAGTQPVDEGAVRAAWDARPQMEMRTVDRFAPGLGTLPPSDPGLPPLPLAGLDPDLGMQLRFRVVVEGWACGSDADAREILAAVNGFRLPPFAKLGRWAAAEACPTGSGTPAISAAWPRP